MRYVIMMIVLVLAIIGASYGRFDFSKPNPKLVNPVNPDPRVRWEAHDVSRFILERPDTKARFTLPDGTFIQIPVALRDTVDV